MRPHCRMRALWARWQGDARRAPLLTNMAVNGWDLTSLEFPGRDVRNVDCERAGGRARRHVLVTGSNGAEDGYSSANGTDDLQPSAYGDLHEDHSLAGQSEHLQLGEERRHHHERSPVSFASAKRGTNKSGWPREDLSRPGQNSDTCLSARSTASRRSSRGFLVAAVSRVRWRAMLIIFLSFPASVCRAVLLMPAFATAFACHRPPTLTPAMAERAAEYLSRG